MAAKKSANTALQQKVKVLAKLYDSGCKNRKGFEGAEPAKYFENPRYIRFRYDGYYRASGADRKKQALFLFGRCG